MLTLIEALRDSLATIPGVASCKIGLEANISPADYPLIRLVPSRVEPGQQAIHWQTVTRKAEVLIYFGMDTTEADGGLEAVYTDLFALEASILAKLAPPPSPCVRATYLETITDEDRLDTYKLMAVRALVEG